MPLVYSKIQKIETNFMLHMLAYRKYKTRHQRHHKNHKTSPTDHDLTMTAKHPLKPSVSCAQTYHKHASRKTQTQKRQTDQTTLTLTWVQSLSPHSFISK